jgi:hypothetical protein
VAVSTKKCDNRSLDHKVQLRTEAIDRAQPGLGPLRVLDLCAGLGLVWKATRILRPIESYTPNDIKPRMPGCLKGDLSPHSLDRFDLADFNVIDVDTYGEPWSAWAYLAPRVKRKTVVFLTRGFSGSARTQSSSHLLQSMGIPPSWAFNIKPDASLAAFGDKYALSSASAAVVVEWCGHIYTPNHAGGGVDYYALICKPRP